MKWMIEDVGHDRPDYLDISRVYEIRNCADSCTLFYKGRDIGSFITVDGAKKAAQVNEIEIRKRS